MYTIQEWHHSLRWAADDPSRAGDRLRSMLHILRQNTGPCCTDDLPGIIDNAIRLGHLRGRRGACGEVYHPEHQNGWGITVYKRKLYAVREGFIVPHPLTPSMQRPGRPLKTLPGREKDIEHAVHRAYVTVSLSVSVTD